MSVSSNSVLFLAATLTSCLMTAGTALAKEGAVEIGAIIPAEDLHIVKEPGRYGLGPELPGSHYAVVENLLIRIDAKTGAVQSIIRKVDGIRD